MATLLLLRHAKSSWDHPGLRDIERPLAPRGQRASRAIGRLLARTGPVPDVVLCSPSQRTRETWDGVRSVWPEAPEPTIEPALYHASPSSMLDLVQELDYGDVAVLLAHNPGTEELASALVGEGDPVGRDRIHQKYPTGALAEIAFEGGWTDVDWGRGTLVRFVRPRDLDDEGRKRE